MCLKKTSAVPRFLNTLLGVWICDQTLFRVFQKLLQSIKHLNLPFIGVFFRSMKKESYFQVGGDGGSTSKGFEIKEPSRPKR